ncbi:glycosyltransferase [Alloscardovia criceti]|uniref:glycosyltransferase n=1 Tax=Alloscardovia criceti TaxID=356828 RepID=UPI0003813107|nr:glycosyltransferase [Alloscardovia criceti]
MWETVSRVVFPVQDAEQTMPLYAIDWVAPHVKDATLDGRIDMLHMGVDSLNQTAFQKLIRHSGAAQAGVSSKDFTVSGRTTLRVRPGGHVSLCTYFNAFPASYWRRWTRVSTVQLSVQVQGSGVLNVYRSSGRGLIYPVSSQDFSATELTALNCEIPMTNLMDGGYFWFDIEANETDRVIVKDARWQVPLGSRAGGEGAEDKRLSIAITTFNRARYCLNQLQTIAQAEELRKRLDTIYCTDQGTELVRELPEFAEVAENLGDQLTYLRQGNIGGSGGFSRGMYETVMAGKSSHVLLLDDDAISEPESILRAIQFTDYAPRPVLVGGGMLHLDNRTMLYTQGERLDLHRMVVSSSAELPYNHDFSVDSLRDSPERHQRVDSDFNGWWMCLIPVECIKQIGLSLPVFIKFDDMEYGVRAKRAGFPTVCLPGVAVWHQAWHDKDPSRTWEEYFMHRNRWIAGLMLNPDNPPRMMVENMYGASRLGLGFAYSAMALHTQALRDIVRGPEYMVSVMSTKLGEVRQLRGMFEDAQTRASIDDFPEVLGEAQSPRLHPIPRSARYKSAFKQIFRSFTSNVKAADAKNPEAIVPSQDFMWAWLAMGGLKSALVSAPDGNSVAWFKRDDAMFRRSMIAEYRATRAILKNWKALSHQYRSSQFASLETWAKIFEANAIKD